MTPEQRASLWAMITVNIVVWSAAAYVVATGIETAPWWTVFAVVGVACGAGIAVGRFVGRQG